MAGSCRRDSAQKQRYLYKWDWMMLEYIKDLHCEGEISDERYGKEPKYRKRINFEFA